MFNYTSQEFIQILPYWGYPAMLFLMIVEGPIATIVSAFLASMGYFNVFAVFGLSVLGDVVGDIILFHIGYFGGARILAKAEKFLKISAATVEKLKTKFHQNSSRIIFYVKSTTGLSYIAFILAGTLRMSFWKFTRSSIFGGLVWSSFLVIIGYFFGYAADRISEYIKYAGIILFIGVILFFVGITLYKKRQTKEILN